MRYLLVLALCAVGVGCLSSDDKERNALDSCVRWCDGNATCIDACGRLYRPSCDWTRAKPESEEKSR